MKIRLMILAVLATVVSAVPGYAHHSDVAYETRAIELKEATIVNFAWKNPHGIVVCDVKEEGGKVARWTLESGSPSAMQAAGWSKNSLNPGDVVHIDVNPAKNGTKFGRLLKVTTGNGTALNYREVVR